MAANKVWKIDVKLDIGTARGWLQRLVRPLASETIAHWRQERHRENRTGQ